MVWLLEEDVERRLLLILERALCGLMRSVLPLYMENLCVVVAAFEGLSALLRPDVGRALFGRSEEPPISMCSEREARGLLLFALWGLPPAAD